MGTLYLGGQRVLPVLKVGEGVTSRNIGEIVASTIPLTDAGLHLLNGDVINGDGVYSAFTEYIASSYDSSSKKSNVTKVGSLTDDDCVLSGFSTSNYAQMTSYPTSVTSFEIQFKFTTGNDFSSERVILGQSTANRTTPQLGITAAGYSNILVSTDGSTWDAGLRVTGLTTNTTYIANLKWNGSKVSGTLTDANGNVTNYATYGSYTDNLSSCNWTEAARIGIDVLAAPCENMSIDLKESYININGQRWWTGANPSWATDESQWQTSVATYGVCGKFVYDSTNNTVRLPKITSIIEGTTDVTALGDLVQAGLPNITGTWGGALSAYDSQFGTGAVEHTNAGIGYGYNSAEVQGVGFNFNASLSNSIYGNSNTVQPQTIKAFYYIVIATSTKTDIQVDIDEIATDLNGKVDKSSLSTVHCVVETYQNGTSWYRIYDDGWCEQGGRVNAVYSGTSVSLLKQYVNTNYNVIVTVATNAGNDQATVNPFGLISSESAILVGSGYSAGHSCHWRTCGYIN